MKGGNASRSRPDRTGSQRPEPRWKTAPAKNPTEYVASLPPDRKAAVERLRAVLRKNLPRGFVETVDYGMIGYVVPLSLYPAGYLGDPKRALPFLSIASQKRYVSLYHLGLYGGPLLEWFRSAWPRHTSGKLDLGKSCLRFRNLEEIPYALIGELAARMSPQQWIRAYEAAHGKPRGD